MKNFYSLLFALLFVVSFTHANNSEPQPTLACDELPLDAGPGVVYPPNSLYAIAAFTGGNNLGRFSYFPDSDILNYDPAAIVASGTGRAFGMDYNPANGLAYILIATGPGDPRELYTIDLSTGTTTFVATVVSSSGDTMPNAMTFDSNGTLYATFGGGELQTIDLTTGLGSAVGTTPGSGGAGLTYDWDNNRLIYAFGAGPIDFYEIDPVFGVSNLLFTAPNVPGGPAGACSAQAIEYLGNGKCISSSTFGCGIIYTVDLNSSTLNSLSDPNPFDLSIKDLMYVNPGTPFSVSCNDATLEVQSDLSVPLNAFAISDAPVNNLYAVDAFAGGTTNIHLYDYDPLTDAISVLNGPAGSTGAVEQFYGIDYHPIENQVYMINDDPVFVRSLFRLDVASGTPTFVANLTSPLGDTQPQDLTFGGDGALYITFKSGEIALYDIATDTMITFANVGAAGAAGGVGLTYDWDNNRLLHTSGGGTATLTGIDIATGAVSLVTTFPIPTGGACTAQGFEYVGGDKAISASTFGCDIIYSVDILAGTSLLLTNPTSDGFSSAIKDLMYIDLGVVLSPATLDCGDVGVNTVSVTVTDYLGNVSTCDSNVTVTDPNGYCTASVNDLIENQFVLFPNPVGDSFQIQWNANQPLIGIQVFDILGKAVLTLDTVQTENPMINIAALAPGVYIIKLKTDLGSTTARLVKY